MKIAVVGTRGFPHVQGGVEKHCEELYPRLAALGCDVTVFSRVPYTGSKAYEYRGVKIVPLPCPKHKYLEAFLHTFLGVLKARELKADILHVHAIGPALFAPLARALGMKVVLTHHGPDYRRQKWNGFAKAVLRLGEKLGIGFAHRTITLSETLVDEIRRKFGQSAELIPNGVVIQEKIDGDETLRRYDLERGKYILAVGRFVPEKGFMDLVDSFDLFSSQEANRRHKLVLVGDADHEDKFSKELKEKSRRIPDVVLTGFQTGRALQELYSHAGLFIQPSHYEGLPIALLEAMSYGSSCLVSDIPANREIVLDEDRYFKAGDVDMMSRKLNEFLEESRTKLHSPARLIEQVIQKYDWDQIARKTLGLYEALHRPAFRPVNRVKRYLEVPTNG